MFGLTVILHVYSSGNQRPCSQPGSPGTKYSWKAYKDMDFALESLQDSLVNII